MPKTKDDRLINLFNLAAHHRQNCDFEKAQTIYEKILAVDCNSAEAFWGCLLSKFGVEYVEQRGGRIPTLHRVQSLSVLSDPDYLATLKNAPDAQTAEIYRTEAEKIFQIQKNILRIAANEKPYDVFICYKENDDHGGRTMDSVLAQEIYYLLEKEGYKVFFSRVTLESKLGTEYEPYIFSALNSAKVMLVIGTKPEHYNAVWVKNEWSRFLDLMSRDKSKVIIPCYRYMDAYSLPAELSIYQSQDMGKLGFAQDLIHGIKKLIPNNVPDDNPRPDDNLRPDDNPRPDVDPRPYNDRAAKEAEFRNVLQQYKAKYPSSKSWMVLRNVTYFLFVIPSLVCMTIGGYFMITADKYTPDFINPMTLLGGIGTILFGIIAWAALKKAAEINPSFLIGTPLFSHSSGY